MCALGKCEDISLQPQQQHLKMETFFFKALKTRFICWYFQYLLITIIKTTFCLEIHFYTDTLKRRIIAKNLHGLYVFNTIQNMHHGFPIHGRLELTHPFVAALWNEVLCSQPQCSVQQGGLQEAHALHAA